MAHISVIIPAYNQGHYLAEAVQSVLDQTYSNFEIWIIDDGSTDNTAEIARGFSDPRVNYIYQSNQGLSAARNTGLRQARGDYISYLDSDDLFLPEKLECLVAAIQQNPAWGMVAGHAVIIDENGVRTGNTYTLPIPAPTEKLLLGNPLHVGSVLVSRSWQIKAGEFDESLRSYEDWDMWLRLAKMGCNFGFVEKPVALYRFHTAQMTRIGRQMTHATFAVLDKTFSQSDLPASWLVIKDKAYSAANLRAMAQAYLAEDYDQANSYLRQAIQFDPELLVDHGKGLANKLSALSESPKNACRLRFLEQIYANLPDEAEVLRKRTPQELGRVAYESARTAYQNRDYRKTRHYLGKTLGYQPSILITPGFIPTMLKSIFHP